MYHRLWNRFREWDNGNRMAPEYERDRGDPHLMWLLGKEHEEDFPKWETDDEMVRAVRQLTGPNGYTIYRMLLAKRRC